MTDSLCDNRIANNQQTDKQNNAGYRAGVKYAVIILGNRQCPSEIGFGYR